jgi:hypothetical protein
VDEEEGLQDIVAFILLAGEAQGGKARAISYEDA